jgi:hypothetical protein
MVTHEPHKKALLGIILRARKKSVSPIARRLSLENRRHSLPQHRIPLSTCILGHSSGKAFFCLTWR